MTTTIAFTPSVVAPFTFSPILDGQTYNASVTWALWGQRWYLNLLTSTGVLIFTKAIVSSTDPVVTPLTTTVGQYTASITVPPAPALLTRGWTVNSVNVPSGTTITVATRAGVVRLSQPATATGTDPNASFSYVVDLLGGYGFASTLAFYDSSQTFVTNP